MGNITELVGSSNEALSNKPFVEKIDKEEVRYKYSNIRLSDDIIDSEVWNEKNIQKRTKKLTEK